MAINRLRTSTENVFRQGFGSGNTMGRDYQIDLKRRPFAICGWQISYAMTFSVGIGVTAIAKGWLPELGMKQVHLSGTRPGSTDSIKKLTGTQISRLNGIDWGVGNVPRSGPFYAGFVYGPGVYTIGATLRVWSAPTRMNYDFQNSCLIAGPAYSSLGFTLTMEQWANMWSAVTPVPTFLDMSMEINEVDAINVDVSTSKFNLFVEQYTRAAITASNPAFQIRPSVGNFYKQLAFLAYERDTNNPDDTLIDTLKLETNISTPRSETWTGIRGKNLIDYNQPVGLSNATAGMAVLEFAEQGDESELLDTRDFGYKGTDMRISMNIPIAPASLRYIDTVERFIQPSINA